LAVLLLSEPLRKTASYKAHQLTWSCRLPMAVLLLFDHFVNQQPARRNSSPGAAGRRLFAAAAL
jgi:hypothetical protein